MNRALVCTLTLAIATVATSAMAQVGLSLNLTYTDPADPSEGGTWELVVLGTDVVGVSAILDGIDNPAGVATNVANEAETLVDDPNNAGFAPSFSVGGGVYQVGYVQDNTAGLVGGVGAGGAADPLNNTNWDGAEVVVTGGTFGGTRPSFVTAGINTTEINVLSGGNAVAGTFATIDGVLSPTVRGDGVADDGLLSGDADRSGTVDFLDLSALSSNFNAAVAPGVAWASGDFDDSDMVDFLDLSALSGNFNASSTPPAVGAVPEPASAVLVLMGLAAAGMRRRS